MWNHFYFHFIDLLTFPQDNVISFLYLTYLFRFYLVLQFLKTGTFSSKRVNLLLVFKRDIRVLTANLKVSISFKNQDMKSLSK